MDLFAAEAVRFGVSDRAAAALWNGAIRALEESDFLEKSKSGPIAKNLTVDKFKMGRAKDSVAKKQKEKKKEEAKAGIQCIGTDGKRDRKTKIVKMITVNGVEKESRDTGTEVACSTRMSFPLGKSLMSWTEVMVQLVPKVLAETLAKQPKKIFM